jgi:hypothetical protein
MGLPVHPDPLDELIDFLTSDRPEVSKLVERERERE